MDSLASPRKAIDRTAVKTDYRIIVPETAYLIWKMRIIRDDDSQERENTARLSRRRDRERMEKRAKRKIASSWMMNDLTKEPWTKNSLKGPGRVAQQRKRF